MSYNFISKSKINSMIKNAGYDKSDIEVNQALSEQMIEDLTIEELKSVIGQLNLTSHYSLIF